MRELSERTPCAAMLLWRLVEVKEGTSAVKWVVRGSKWQAEKRGQREALVEGVTAIGFASFRRGRRAARHGGVEKGRAKAARSGTGSDQEAAEEKGKRGAHVRQMSMDSIG